MEQNYAAAADFHVIAALEGDPEAIRNLTEYRGEIERAAIEGNQSAALVLAKMYDRGLGVTRDQPTMLAWLVWGGDHCAQDGNYAEELESIREFYEPLLSNEQKKSARRTLAGFENRKIKRLFD